MIGNRLVFSLLFAGDVIHVQDSKAYLLLVLYRFDSVFDRCSMVMNRVQNQVMTVESGKL